MSIANTDLIEVVRGGVSYKATGTQLNNYLTPVYNTWDPASPAAGAYSVSGNRASLARTTKNGWWSTVKTTIPIPRTGKWMTEFKMNKEPGSGRAWLGVCEKSNAAHPTTTDWYVSRNASTRSLGMGNVNDFNNSGGGATYTEGNFNYQPWHAGNYYYICVDRDGNKIEVFRAHGGYEGSIAQVFYRDPSVLNLNLDPNKEYVFAVSAEDKANGGTNPGDNLDITMNAGKNGWYSTVSWFLAKGYQALHNRV
jgi:hypothetical protein